MMRRGRLEAVGEIDVRRILRGEPRGENRAENEKNDERDSDGRQGVVAGEAGSAANQLPVAGGQLRVSCHFGKIPGMFIT